MDNDTHNFYACMEGLKSHIIWLSSYDFTDFVNSYIPLELESNLQTGLFLTC